MFSSKDGKKFGSAFVAKRRDSEHDKADQMSKTAMGDSPAHEAAEKPDFEAGEQEGAKEGMENTDPKQVVAEHGKANTVHIAHDHKNKKHHVVSTHESGHVHSSDHESASDAHNHAAALAGGDEAAAGMGEPEAPEADGFSMPKLA